MGAVVLGPKWYPPAPLPIFRENVLAPYTPAEVTKLLAWARGLPTERFRHTAGGVIALGLGAGLSSQEQSRLAGDDVSSDGEGSSSRSSAPTAGRSPCCGIGKTPSPDSAVTRGRVRCYSPNAPASAATN